MCDMEVHEHVLVNGATGTLRNPLIHHNIESLSRYIDKHNQYSNWEVQVWLRGEASFRDLKPSLFGTQAQRRRWLKKRLLSFPGSPVLFFFYKYLFRLGVPGWSAGLI